MNRPLRRGLAVGALVLLGVAVLLAPNGRSEDGEAKEKEEDRPPRLRVTWGKVPAERLGWDVAIEVPTEWAETGKMLGEAELHLGAPRDDGVVPELIYGWRPSPRSLEEWGGREIRNKEALGITVGERGTTTVAGFPALWCIETYAGGGRTMRRFNVYYKTPRGIGFVYGIATARTFLDYRPIFEQAARRIRYAPAPK